MSLVGQLLIASPMLADANFADGVVLICVHDPEGAVGVVLNRPTELAVAEHLPDWGDAAVPPAVVFLGGPVQIEVAIGIATLASGVTEWTAVVGDTGVIDLGSVSSGLVGRARIFAGYAGWGEGQLDAEVTRGDWIVVPADPDDPFDADPTGLRRRVLSRQTDATRFYADYPDDPGLN